MDEARCPTAEQPSASPACGAGGSGGQCGARFYARVTGLEALGLAGSGIIIVYFRNS